VLLRGGADPEAPPRRSLAAGASGLGCWCGCMGVQLKLGYRVVLVTVEHILTDKSGFGKWRRNTRHLRRVFVGKIQNTVFWAMPSARALRASHQAPYASFGVLTLRARSLSQHPLDLLAIVQRGLKKFFKARGGLLAGAVGWPHPIVAAGHSRGSKATAALDGAVKGCSAPSWPTHQLKFTSHPQSTGDMGLRPIPAYRLRPPLSLRQTSSPV